MGFEQIPQPPLWQGRLGEATATVVGGRGLRLTGLSGFHLDEGPELTWLNVYRVLAKGRQLDIPRDRPPAAIEAVDGAVEVRWAPTAQLRAEVAVRYRLVEAASAVEAAFHVRCEAAYQRLELFVSSYFTPYYRPSFAVGDRRLAPEPLVWYEKRWYGEDEDETWTRDPEADAVFEDGRWQTGYPLNWRRGAHYAEPLMIQEHRYGHAVALMSRRADCIGLSGLNSYHNAQYHHLFGADTAAGEERSATVRLAVLAEWKDLRAEVLARYRDWVGGGRR